MPFPVGGLSRTAELMAGLLPSWPTTWLPAPLGAYRMVPALERDHPATRLKVKVPLVSSAVGSTFALRVG